jgi:hypothetical protein
MFSCISAVGKLRLFHAATERISNIHKLLIMIGALICYVPLIRTTGTDWLLDGSALDENINGSVFYKETVRISYCV